jgi:hypothetical protein
MTFDEWFGEGPDTANHCPSYRADLKQIARLSWTAGLLEGCSYVSKLHAEANEFLAELEATATWLEECTGVVFKLRAAEIRAVIAKTRGTDITGGSNRWTHNICETCWHAISPDREPCALKSEYAKEETCCWCGKTTKSGIYVRADPQSVKCQGKHGDSA